MLNLDYILDVPRGKCTRAKLYEEQICLLSDLIFGGLNVTNFCKNARPFMLPFILSETFCKRQEWP